MVGRTGNTPEVLPRYARLLGARGGRAHREASEAARACLTAMRFRFPDALYLVELVIRLGEVGAFDLIGSVKQIADHIGELLGESPPDAAKLQRAMRSVCGKTCLVERQSRQLWRLCLAGLCDPTSPQHRRLLEETPSPYRLGGAEPQAARSSAAETDLRRQLEAALAQLGEVEAERQALRNERAELERQLVGVRGEFVGRTAELEVLRHERDEARDALQGRETTFGHEREVLERRIQERDATISELRELLAARDEQLRDARERRQGTDAAPGQDEMRRQLEELLLEREIALEDAGRQLAAQGAEHEKAVAAAEERRCAAEAAAAEEAARSAGLRALLKDERERRRATEGRLRRLQVALRVKLVGDDHELTELDLWRDEVCLAEVHRVLKEHVSAQHEEREQLAIEPVTDLERLEELDEDVRAGNLLGRLLARALAEEFPDS